MVLVQQMKQIAQKSPNVPLDKNFALMEVA
jgi:hypothetical protein